MSEEGREGEKLLEGIAEEAKGEAEKIRREAEREAEEIVAGAERRAEETMREAEEKGEEQARMVRTKNSQTVEAEQRRLRLRAEEKIFNKVIDTVHRRLGELRETEGYGDILQGLIAEAALGLGVEEAEINASVKEREYITDTLLAGTEEEIRKNGGATKLGLSDNSPISRQGVVVDKVGGRLSYNNTFEARLRRYAAELRRMIYEEIKEQPE